LEAKKKELESLLHEKNGGVLNGQQFIPASRACFQNLVNNLENVEAACLWPIREQIKSLVSGQIKLHPTDQGHLEAELAGDYAEFLKLTGEKSKIMVVAGARFCHFFTPPIRISLISEKCPIANKTSHSKNFHPFKKAKYRDSKL
jgi:hypothetical protein